MPLDRKVQITALFSVLRSETLVANIVNISCCKYP